MLSRTHQNMFLIAAICALFFFILMITGCSSDAEAAPKKEKHDGPPRDTASQVLVPEATGTAASSNDVAAFDYSNASQGYVMVNYSGTNEKVKFQLKTPDGTEYTYLVTDLGQYEVYPLSGGDGHYTAYILESVAGEKDMYSIAFTQEFDVTLANEFLPYLYPNHYVSFRAESALVSKGESLAADCYADLDVVTNIYNYVIKNISYDKAKAEDIPYGYTPDPDATLADGTGICFDYASLMASMLRSQKIPTKLEVGYSGEAYHAWISVYLEESGWVDNIIEFDGSSWSLMDPTLAANNSGSSVKKYIGDGSKYTVKYTY